MGDSQRSVNCGENTIGLIIEGCPIAWHVAIRRRSPTLMSTSLQPAQTPSKKQTRIWYRSLGFLTLGILTVGGVAYWGWGWSVANLIPKLVNLDQIRHEVLQELAEATELEPVMGDIVIEPTLFDGVKVTFKEIQLLNNPAFRQHQPLKIRMNSVKSTPTAVLGSNFKSAVNKPLESPSATPYIQVKSARIFLRYLPLAQSQRLEIAKAQLDSVRILGGHDGVFTHYFPVIYEKDYFEKHKKPNRPDVSLKNAQLLLTNMRLVQTLQDFEATPKQFSMQLNRLTLDHILSNSPLKLKAQGEWGRHALNRQFTLQATTTALGSNATDALNKNWALSDLNNAKLVIRSMQAVSPEQIEFHWLPSKRHGQQKIIAQSSPLDLTTWQQMALASARLLEIELPAPWQELTLSGKTKLSAETELVLNPKTNTLQLSDYQGNLALQNIALSNQNTPLIHALNGSLQFSEDRVSIPQASVLFDTSRFSISGKYDIKADQLDAKVITQQLALKPLLNSWKKLQPLATQLAKKFNTPLPDTAILNDYDLNAQLTTNLTLIGPLKAPDYRGKIQLENGILKANNSGATLENIQATIHIDEAIQLKSGRAQFASATLHADGLSDKALKNYHLNLNAQQLDLAKLHQAAIGQFSDLKTALQEIRAVSGMANLTAQLKSPDQIFGTIQIQKLGIEPALANGHDRIEFPNLTIALKQHQLEIPKTTGHFGPLPLTITVQADLNSPQFKLDVTTGDLPVAILRDQKAFFTRLAGPATTLPNIWNTEGSFSTLIHATESKRHIDLAFHNAGLSWEGAQFPLYHLNGTLGLVQTGNTQDLTSFHLQPATLRFRYGNSPVSVQIKQDAQQGKIQLLATGTLSPLAVNHFLTSPHATHAPYQEIPFKLSVQQDAKQQLLGKLFLDLDNMLKNKNQSTITTAAPPSSKESKTFIETQFAVYPTANALAKAPTIQLYPSRLHLDNEGDLWTEGWLANYMNLPEATYQFRLLTSPVVNLTEMSKRFRGDLFQGAGGELAADLQIWAETPQTPQINGWLEMNAVQFPQLLVDNLTGNIEFMDDPNTPGESKAVIDFPSVNFQGAALSFKAETHSPTTFPVPLENVKIQGSGLNLPGVQDFSHEVIGKTLVENVVQRFIRPWQEGDPISPVEFRDADVKINEVVYQNIILDNLKGKLSLFANSYFQLTDTSLSVAGGNVTGFLSMNPFDDNFTSLDMNADNVQVNAITHALLNVSNQIFGKMSGSIRFTTEGASDLEMLENANGTVKMKITEGRLPALTQIETLLTAANIIRGGVLGLNLNNIFRAVAPFRANYFAELSGDLLIAEKKLHTNNLLSDGDNLDLLMQGTVSMEDGNANMLINGTMNQTVKSKLGFLGSFSIGSLFRFVPILGFIPGEKQANSSGLIYKIPGVGYVPGLGGSSRDASRFQVKLQGPPQDPKSIQSFGWVKTFNPPQQ